MFVTLPTLTPAMRTGEPRVQLVGRLHDRLDRVGAPDHGSGPPNAEVQRPPRRCRRSARPNGERAHCAGASRRRPARRRGRSVWSALVARPGGRSAGRARRARCRPRTRRPGRLPYGSTCRSAAPAWRAAANSSVWKIGMKRNQVPFSSPSEIVDERVARPQPEVVAPRLERVEEAQRRAERRRRPSCRLRDRAARRRVLGRARSARRAASSSPVGQPRRAAQHRRAGLDAASASRARRGGSRSRAGAQVAGQRAPRRRAPGDVACSRARGGRARSRAPRRASPPSPSLAASIERAASSPRPSKSEPSCTLTGATAAVAAASRPRISAAQVGARRRRGCASPGRGGCSSGSRPAIAALRSDAAPGEAVAQPVARDRCSRRACRRRTR